MKLSSSDLTRFMKSLDLDNSEKLAKKVPLRVLLFMVESEISNNSINPSASTLKIVDSILKAIYTRRDMLLVEYCRKQDIAKSQAELLPLVQSNNISLFNIFHLLTILINFHCTVLLHATYMHRQEVDTAKTLIIQEFGFYRLYMEFVCQSEEKICLGTNSNSRGDIWSRCLLTCEDYFGVGFTTNSENVQSLFPKLKNQIILLYQMGMCCSAHAEYSDGSEVRVKPILNGIMSTNNCLRVESAELLNNEGYIAAQQRQFNYALVLFSRSIELLYGRSDVRIDRIMDGLYSCGLLLLMSRRFDEAFVFFERVVNCSKGSCGNNNSNNNSGATDDGYYDSSPLVWIRLAECCLQFVAQSEIIPQPPHSVQIESISFGRSRRASCRATNLKNNESHSHGSLSVASAVLYLERALVIVTNNAKRKTGDAISATTVAENQKRILDQIYLRLVYAYVKLGDFGSALQHATKLVSSLNSKDKNNWSATTAYLAYNYYVVILCRLGKLSEALEFLREKIEVTNKNSEEWFVSVNEELRVTPNGQQHQHQQPQHSSYATEKNSFIAQQINKTMVLLLRSQTSAALAILEPVLRNSPGHVPALRCLVFIYIRQGRFRQALNVMAALKRIVVTK